MKQKNVLLKFIWIGLKAYPIYYLVVILKALLVTAITLFNTYSLSYLINFLQEKELKYCLIFGTIIVGSNFVFFTLKTLVEYFEDRFTLMVEQILKRRLGFKLMSVPYFYLEDSYYLDLKERAVFATQNQGSFRRFFTNMSVIVESSFTIVSLAVVLLAFDYIVFLVLIGATAVFILLVLLGLKVELSFYKEILPINRKFSFYLDAILEKRNAKDFRFYPIGEMLVKRFDDFSKESQYFINKTMFYQSTLQSITAIFRYGCMAFVYCYVAIKKILGKISSLGEFSLYINAAISFSSKTESIVKSFVELLGVVKYVAPFVELWEIEEDVNSGTNPISDIESIEFKNLSFKYPKTKNYILEDISFKIARGEHIGIVGLNGAGKTTLIKLLCKLYNPTSGQILINGKDISTYDKEQYYSLLSAVFQDYTLFDYSIKENIAGTKDADITKVIQDVGLKEKIDSLPEKENTLYGKEFDDGGIELSGGQSQKVAIARALYRDSKLIILDEPTSALDPLAEADIYQNFNRLVSGKTAIYISHRMSSSVFCDKILVLENGKVSDFDSHQNLLKKDCLYSKLFNLQAINYK